MKYEPVRSPYHHIVLKKISQHILKYYPVKSYELSNYKSQLDAISTYILAKLNFSKFMIPEFKNKIFSRIKKKCDVAYGILNNFDIPEKISKKLSIHVVGPVTAGKTTTIGQHKLHNTTPQYRICEQPITDFNGSFCIAIRRFQQVFDFFSPKVPIYLDGKSMGPVKKYLRLVLRNPPLSKADLPKLIKIKDVKARLAAINDMLHLRARPFRPKINSNLISESGLPLKKVIVQIFYDLKICVPGINKQPVVAKLGTTDTGFVICFENLLNQIARPEIVGTRVSLSGEYINYLFQFGVLAAYNKNYYNLGQPIVCQRGFCDIPTFLDFSKSEIPKKYLKYFDNSRKHILKQYNTHIVCILPAYSALKNRKPQHLDRSEEDLKMIYNRYVKRYVDSKIETDYTLKLYDSRHNPLDISEDINLLAILWDFMVRNRNCRGMF